MDAAAVLPSAATDQRPSRLAWLTPGRCRAIFILLLIFGFASHLHYLIHDCPIDLSGDEAQYWDWSRNLDLSYYSKGPLVAYIIRASCAIFGDTMPAVRLPALVFGVCTLIVTYLLTRKLFQSDRIALGAVLLFHIVPMFVAGSVLMTIDPPYFFCWAIATYLLAIGIFDGKRWVWPLIGVAAGVGFLAKYAMLLWFVPMLITLAIDRPARPLLRTKWPWLAILISLLATIQVIVWNSRHDWVSFKHVSTQTGASHGHFELGNVLELVGGQIGILGPALFLFMVAGCVYAFRRSAGERTPDAAGIPAETDHASSTVALQQEPYRRQMRFCAVFAVAFFSFNFIISFVTKVQMNWPAPAYFTGVILAAYFLATRMRSPLRWRRWRPWFWLNIAFGLLMLPIAHDPEVLFPAVHWLNAHVIPLKEPWTQAGGVRKLLARSIPNDPIEVQQVDFTYKLKGWQEVGKRLSSELRDLGDDSFAMCHDYQQAADLAFYLDGQPKTYYAASYYRREIAGRLTQYDIWPDRNLGPDSPLIGKNAVFLGRFDRPIPELYEAFERVEGVPEQREKVIDGKPVEVTVQRAITLELKRDDLELRTFRYFRCYGFKGMKRDVAESQLNH